MKKILLFFTFVMLLMAGLSSCSSSKKVPSTGGPIAINPSEIPTPGSTSIFNRKKKLEFRGAWIQTAFQDRYMAKTPQQCQAYLTQLVQSLYETGVNAIIFQVRPEGDAFYASELEPWSRFLTGTQGKAPEPFWDPMAFIIKLCHDRKMEFHAWINPYRMTCSKTTKLASNHLFYSKPEWFVRYDGRLYLNPGLPECRAYIRDVVRDIVSRYDIDAIHMDDYFYPYPVGGQKFDDRQAFETYAPVMGFDTSKASALADWRRRNVDILIRYVSEDIKKIKPGVRFGISPFGIYRNKKSWSGGSNTNGLQCYDDLYADVLKWAQSGWIDYLIPQVYWEIGHKSADYQTLCKWWGDNVPGNCQLYIGQDISRSLDGKADSKPTPDLTKKSEQMKRKLNQVRQHKNIRGNCFWYGYQIEENAYHVRDFLRLNPVRR